MGKKKTYTARYTREGDAWTVTFTRPDLTTWAATLKAAQRAAREAPAVTLDYPSVEALLTEAQVIDLVGQDSELARRAAPRARRVQLAAEEADVARQTAELGRALVEGMSTRDAGAALGVSGARIVAGATERDTSGSLAVAGELGAGKALALDTPIPTPTGWTTMGELKPGDQVFDEQGQSTMVLGTSPVMTGHRCYAVQFSDGSMITADAEHLWSTIPGLLDLAEGLIGPSWPEHAETVTTEQMQQTLLTPGPAGQVNHAIPSAGALQLPPADLPVDPYVLGTWLSDSSSHQPQVPGADRERHGRLRTTGVLRDKQIPPAYLRGSVTQRQALLAGLLQADGTVTALGSVQYVSANRQVAADVHELACSLGHRPALRHGVKCSVVFTPTEQLFGLSPTQQARLERTVRSWPARHRFRYVVNVQEVPSAPVQCIRVASNSSLYLAGRSMIPTHNSVLLKKRVGGADLRYRAPFEAGLTAVRNTALETGYAELAG